MLRFRTLRAVKNPRYTGAFVYGRHQTRKTAAGRETRKSLPREQWHTLLLDVHPGYITWAQYEENLRRLHENAQANGAERRQSLAREGPALLQGLVVCGRGGERMTVRYYRSHGQLLPEYVCQKRGIETAQPVCQRVLGKDLDLAVGDLLVETVSPLALEVALAVQEELESRADEADRLRRQQVERARYEAELAQRRYLRVDPDNRLVADSLEADWNQKLRALTAAQEDYERRREADGLVLDREQREQILALATDFPRLWREPTTPQRERKRMVRLLLEDVTLHRTDEIVAHVRFRGGATHSLHLPLPLNAAQLRKTDPAVVAEVDRLLDEHTDAEIVDILNSRGLRPDVAELFSLRILYILRRTYGLEDRFTRLRRQGLLTLEEVSQLLGADQSTVVAVDRELSTHDVDTVVVDNRGGACSATLHLVAEGARRLACITGPLEVSTATERLAGYQDALQRSGLGFDASLACSANFKQDGGYAAARVLLTLPDPPDALFVTNNLMTVGALRAIAESGRAVPDDLILASFDEMYWTQLIHPPLTTVSQPTYEMGRVAAQLLAERIAGYSGPGRRRVLETAFQVRQSSLRSSRLISSPNKR